MDLEKIRADFPALERYTWFHNGGVAVLPRPVAEELDRLNRELLERGPMHVVHLDEEMARRERSVARLAKFFDVSPAEIAVVRGVSEAYHVILSGLDWKPGDQVLLTVDEEAALFLPTLHLRERYGVEVVKVPLCEDPADQVNELEKRLGPRSRLLAISHVTTDYGYRLPIQSMCDASRRNGTLSFVDVAHSAGVLPISLREVGCDFAGALSYKWMYAPYAAGLLYVRRDQLDTLDVPFVGSRSEESIDWDRDQYRLSDSARRFQYGPWAWPLVHAWAVATDYLETLGLDAVWERTEKLAGRLKEGASRLPGCVLYTPRSAVSSAALVSFGLEGWRGEDLAATLRSRWNMVIKALPHTREGLRASVPFFLLEKEIDALIAALAELQLTR